MSFAQWTRKKDTQGPKTPRGGQPAVESAVKKEEIDLTSVNEEELRAELKRRKIPCDDAQEAVLRRRAAFINASGGLWETFDPGNLEIVEEEYTFLTTSNKSLGYINDVLSITEPPPKWDGYEEDKANAGKEVNTLMRNLYSQKRYRLLLFKEHERPDNPQMTVEERFNAMMEGIKRNWKDLKGDLMSNTVKKSYDKASAEINFTIQDLDLKGLGDKELMERAKERGYWQEGDTIDIFRQLFRKALDVLAQVNLLAPPQPNHCTVEELKSKNSKQKWEIGETIFQGKFKQKLMEKYKDVGEDDEPGDLMIWCNDRITQLLESSISIAKEKNQLFIHRKDIHRILANIRKVPGSSADGVVDSSLLKWVVTKDDDYKLYIEEYGLGIDGAYSWGVFDTETLGYTLNWDEYEKPKPGVRYYELQGLFRSEAEEKQINRLQMSINSVFGPSGMVALDLNTWKVAKEGSEILQSTAITLTDSNGVSFERLFTNIKCESLDETVLNGIKKHSQDHPLHISGSTLCTLLKYELILRDKPTTDMPGLRALLFLVDMDMLRLLPYLFKKMENYIHFECLFPYHMNVPHKESIRKALESAVTFNQYSVLILSEPEMAEFISLQKDIEFGSLSELCVESSSVHSVVSFLSERIRTSNGVSFILLRITGAISPMDLRKIILVVDSSSLRLVCNYSDVIESSLKYTGGFTRIYISETARQSHTSGMHTFNEDTTIGSILYRVQKGELAAKIPRFQRRAHGNWESKLESALAENELNKVQKVIIVLAYGISSAIFRKWIAAGNKGLWVDGSKVANLTQTLAANKTPIPRVFILEGHLIPEASFKAAQKLCEVLVVVTPFITASLMNLPTSHIINCELRPEDSANLEWHGASDNWTKFFRCVRMLVRSNEENIILESIPKMKDSRDIAHDVTSIIGLPKSSSTIVRELLALAGVLAPLPDDSTKPYWRFLSAMHTSLNRGLEDDVTFFEYVTTCPQGSWMCQVDRVNSYAREIFELDNAFRPGEISNTLSYNLLLGFDSTDESRIPSYTFSCDSSVMSELDTMLHCVSQHLELPWADSRSFSYGTEVLLKMMSVYAFPIKLLLCISPSNIYKQTASILKSDMRDLIKTIYAVARDAWFQDVCNNCKAQSAYSALKWACIVHGNEKGVPFSNKDLDNLIREMIPLDMMGSEVQQCVFALSNANNLLINEPKILDYLRGTPDVAPLLGYTFGSAVLEFVLHPDNRRLSSHSSTCKGETSPFLSDRRWRPFVQFIEGSPDTLDDVDDETLQKIGNGVFAYLLDVSPGQQHVHSLVALLNRYVRVTEDAEAFQRVSQEADVLRVPLERSLMYWVELRKHQPDIRIPDDTCRNIIEGKFSSLIEKFLRETRPCKIPVAEHPELLEKYVRFFDDDLTDDRNKIIEFHSVALSRRGVESILQYFESEEGESQSENHQFLIYTAWALEPSFKLPLKPRIDGIEKYLIAIAKHPKVRLAEKVLESLSNMGSFALYLYAPQYLSLATINILGKSLGACEVKGQEYAFCQQTNDALAPYSLNIHARALPEEVLREFKFTEVEFKVNTSDRQDFDIQSGFSPSTVSKNLSTIVNLELREGLSFGKAQEWFTDARGNITPLKNLFKGRNEDAERTKHCLSLACFAWFSALGIVLCRDNGKNFIMKCIEQMERSSQLPLPFKGKLRKAVEDTWERIKNESPANVASRLEGQTLHPLPGFVDLRVKKEHNCLRLFGSGLEEADYTVQHLISIFECLPPSLNVSATKLLETNKYNGFHLDLCSEFSKRIRTQLERKSFNVEMIEGFTHLLLAVYDADRSKLEPIIKSFVAGLRGIDDQHSALLQSALWKRLGLSSHSAIQAQKIILDHYHQTKLAISKVVKKELDFCKKYSYIPFDCNCRTVDLPASPKSPPLTYDVLMSLSTTRAMKARLAGPALQHDNREPVAPPSEEVPFFKSRDETVVKRISTHVESASLLERMTKAPCTVYCSDLFYIDSRMGYGVIKVHTGRECCLVNKENESEYHFVTLADMLRNGRVDRSRDKYRTFPSFIAAHAFLLGLPKFSVLAATGFVICKSEDGKWTVFCSGKEGATELKPWHIVNTKKLFRIQLKDEIWSFLDLYCRTILPPGDEGDCRGYLKLEQTEFDNLMEKYSSIKSVMQNVKGRVHFGQERLDGKRDHPIRRYILEALADQRLKKDVQFVAQIEVIFMQILAKPLKDDLFEILKETPLGVFKFLLSDKGNECVSDDIIPITDFAEELLESKQSCGAPAEDSSSEDDAIIPRGWDKADGRADSPSSSLSPRREEQGAGTAAFPSEEGYLISEKIHTNCINTVSQETIPLNIEFYPDIEVMERLQEKGYIWAYIFDSRFLGKCRWKESSEAVERWILDLLKSPLDEDWKEYYLKLLLDNFLQTPDENRTNEFLIIAFCIAQACPIPEVQITLMSYCRDYLVKKIPHIETYCKRKSDKYGMYMVDRAAAHKMKQEVPLKTIDFTSDYSNRSRNDEEFYSAITQCFTKNTCFVHIVGLKEITDRLLKWCCEFTEKYPWRFIIFEDCDVTYNFCENRDRCTFIKDREFNSRPPAAEVTLAEPPKFEHVAKLQFSDKEKADIDWINTVKKHIENRVKIIYLVSPPGAGKTYFLENELSGIIKEKKELFVRLDCSSDVLMRIALQSFLEFFYPSNQAGVLVADEFHMLTLPMKDELLRWVAKAQHIRIVLVANRTIDGDDRLFEKYGEQCKEVNARLAIQHVKDYHGDHFKSSANWPIIEKFFRAARLLFSDEAVSYRYIKAIENAIAKRDNSVQVQLLKGLLQDKIPTIGEYTADVFVRAVLAKEPPGNGGALQLLVETALLDLDDTACTYTNYVRQTKNAHQFHPCVRLAGWVSYMKKQFKKGDLGSDEFKLINSLRLVDQFGFPLVLDEAGKNDLPTYKTLKTESDTTDLRTLAARVQQGFPINWESLKKKWRSTYVTDELAFCEFLHAFPDKSAVLTNIVPVNLCDLINASSRTKLSKVVLEFFPKEMVGGDDGSVNPFMQAAWHYLRMTSLDDMDEAEEFLKSRLKDRGFSNLDILRWVSKYGSHTLDVLDHTSDRRRRLEQMLLSVCHDERYGVSELAELFRNCFAVLLSNIPDIPKKVLFHLCGTTHPPLASWPKHLQILCEWCNGVIEPVMLDMLVNSPFVRDTSMKEGRESLSLPRSAVKCLLTVNFKLPADWQESILRSHMEIEDPDTSLPNVSTTIDRNLFDGVKRVLEKEVNIKGSLRTRVAKLYSLLREVVDEQMGTVLIPMACVTPYHFIFCIDISGSMQGSRFSDVIKALVQFREIRGEIVADRYTVVLFNDAVHNIEMYVEGSNANWDKIKSKLERTLPDNITYPFPALQAIRTLLTEKANVADGPLLKSYMVFLTDGDFSCQTVHQNGHVIGQQWGDFFKTVHTTVYSVFFGGDLRANSSQHQYLTTLAGRTGGKFSHSQNTEQLFDLFRQVGQITK